MSPPLASGMYT
ncbi:hypothetical protein Taro_022609 [Colocasia esculenta]|uniref:Uncharacterized protein n=1 Tax=Colocasia esculenta TaxID=4460 RepID=A0A843V480_COLES|nr:hypothetical protein [Colocasia esculenta]